MQLINLMFHQVYHPDEKNSIENFTAFAKDLENNFISVAPGDKLIPGMKHVCLTFDDAYADFYHVIYPILEKSKLKATLGVPTAKIPKFASHDILHRLGVKYPKAFDELHRHPLCSWQELNDLAKQPNITIAAHGHEHVEVLSQQNLWRQEVIMPKKILEDKLGIPIHSFIYPFGKVNKAYHEFCKNHYQWCFRIGGAVNYGWPSNGLLYRVDAEPLFRNGKLLSETSLFPQAGKYWLNRIRGK